MIPRALAAVAVLLAVVLGPDLFLMLSLTIALAVALVFVWRIDQLVMATGWGVVPVRRRRAARAW